MGCIGSKYKLSKADLQFLMENTEFTKQQIKVWYSGFIVDCPSGELSKAKFIEVYQQLFPQGNAQKFCSHIFRTFDTDNSGKIDFKEFLMAINITAKGDPEKKLKWAFKMYDVDGNGEIDKGEMLQIIQSIYDLIGLNPKTNEPLGLTTNNNATNQSNVSSSTNSNGTPTPTTPNPLTTAAAAATGGSAGAGVGGGAANDNSLVVENPVVRTDQIFQKMDLDRNGVISEAEFINGCLQDKFLYQMLTADYSESL